MPQLLAMDLPETLSTNMRAWDRGDLIKGQMRTLLLLTENDCHSALSIIFNQLSHFLCKEVIAQYLLEAARHAKTVCPSAIEIFLDSQAMKGLFYESVTNHGLINYKRSFAAFYDTYLSSLGYFSRDTAQ